MNDLLWPRVFAAFLEDASLAVLCGLLLSSCWLEGHAEREHRGLDGNAADLPVFAILLFLAAWGQLVLLAASFSGQTSLRLVLASMPDVCSTHAGGLSLALCAAAAALCAATWIPARIPRTVFCAFLVLGCLGLHASIGHAAADGAFSFSELLQGIHLAGMALWSGGVIVAGLFAVPRLRREVVGGYLEKLSTVSTWAVCAVILTGIVKSYRATGGSLPPVLSSRWGHILLAKIAIVTITVLLGARNRWLLAAGAARDHLLLRRIARTLRAESLCMLGVLLLSAWLSNTAPPFE